MQLTMLFLTPSLITFYDKKPSAMRYIGHREKEDLSVVGFNSHCVIAT